MKKRILRFTAIAGMATAMLTSGKNGAAFEKGYDNTGAETALGNFAGCGASGVSCHGTASTAGITTVIELDSAGVATTHYKAGMTYTVKISGTNTTSNSLTTFGFQVSCIKGTAAVATPVNAGTFASTGLPTNVQYTPANATYYVCNVVEHSNPIAPTTGTGGTGTTYVESFQWTAPAAGTGSVSFWGTVNACNANNRADVGDLWNTTNLSISEWSTTGVAEVTNNISISAFPNPVSSSLNVHIENTHSGTYSLQVVDMNGRTVTTENIVVNGSSHTATINTGNWTPGTYNVVVSKDGSRQVIPVMKF